jgi:hypothetical protein
MPDEPTYYERTWSDIPQFCCLVCGYDAWSLTQLETHMGVVHDGLALVAGPPETVNPEVPPDPDASGEATLQAEGV